MKWYILPLILIAILSSCSSSNSYTPRDTLVEIRESDGHIVGRWVLLSGDTLTTSAHVLRDCKKSQCIYVSQKYGNLTPSGQVYTYADRDRVDIRLTPLLTPTILWSDPQIDEPVYALVSRSGSWQRIDGKILGIDASYTWYDDALSGTTFTGATSTDIVLEKWESGTPIWTLSWELIGVMSAVDIAEKRGYVVR